MSIPVNGFAQAINAYHRAASTGTASGADGDAPANGGFASLVRTVLSEAAASAERSESLSAAAMVGEADLSQVVTAVAEAEVALQTVVAIRERVVEAYKDILRMPI